MSTIGPLYHWAPANRHDAIKRDGLVAGKGKTVSSYGERQICLGTNPAGAWRLSGAMEWVDQVDEWDCWQVALAENDAVHIRPVYGDRIEEIRVDGPIPPDRIWHVGRRTA